MVHRLTASNEELNDLDRDLIDWIVTENPAEGIRIAAFPFAGKNQLLGHLPEIANDLNYNLRQLTANKEHPAGIVNRMQSLAAVALQRAKDAGSHADNVVRTAALREVERHALQLGNWAGMFLGADLLASAWTLAYSRGLDCDRFTSLWLTMNSSSAPRSGWEPLLARADNGRPQPVVVAQEGRPGVRTDGRSAQGFRGEVWREVSVAICAAGITGHDQRESWLAAGYSCRYIFLSPQSKYESFGYTRHLDQRSEAMEDSICSTCRWRRRHSSR